MKQDNLTSEIAALKAEHQKVVEQLEKRYLTIVNVLFPNFIFVFNEEFLFTDIITPEGLKLFHDNQELIGTSARNIYSPEVCELFIANIHECLEKKQLKEIEYHLDLFGTRYYYQARMMPIEDRQVMCLIRDIGDRVRRMEELLAQRKKAEEADKMKSAFLANMSHEIRTPLNAIIGFSEFLVAETNLAKREHHMEIIRNSSRLLLQVVSDVLDLSRIESGKSEIKFEDTDITTIMKEVENIYQHTMKKGIELIVEIPEEEIRALTDANKVKQTLFNLLSNATKNTEKGFVTLKVETAKDDDCLLFSVADTGRGISADKIEVIFNRFEKLDNFGQGVGLGLAISKEIVEYLGGKIWVESEVGMGSTFFFTIPYRNALHQIGSVKNLITNKKKKVLVMMESEQDFLFIQNTLQKDYDLVWAINGEKAINSFILDQPEIVLLDVQMPLLKGDSALKKMRAISTSIPIIAVVADDFYQEQRWAIENGCNDVLSKPFSPSKIAELVLAFT
ncbi:MAG: response regulator [Bacteroidales bacterium]|jgi:signal transduction histidine kinase/CheY-like chemotaxis protein|nr:response regulator [Bacteroidales bacterium]